MYNHPPSRRSHRHVPARLREFYGIVEACPSRAKARVCSSPQHREVDMPKTMHENEARDVYDIKQERQIYTVFPFCWRRLKRRSQAISALAFEHMGTESTAKWRGSGSGASAPISSARVSCIHSILSAPSSFSQM